MACPACGADHVMAVLKPGIGIVRQCGACGVALASDEPEPATPYTPPEQSKAAPKPRPAAKEPRRRLTERSVIAEARAEASALRKSIRAHEKALTRERRQLAGLDRLLDAAAGKPRAVVRAIRTTA